MRFYLESSVSEIRDLKERKIFEQEELTKVMKRRTDFEHRLLSRNARAEDFVAYARYEMKLDRLRQLRVNRLKLGGRTTVSDYAGPRRIVFTLERGTKKFPSNLKLWTELIEYAHKAKNAKATKKALSSVLRTHTRNPEVWVYVAKFQLEQNASVPEARAVMQRGLRFNPQSAYLWLEYMRLELIYIAKLLARRKILGIEKARKEEVLENEADGDEKLTLNELEEPGEELPSLPSTRVDVLGDVESNPALRGDVALAVFDAALASLPASEFLQLGRNAMEIFDQFTSLDRAYLCAHVVERLAEHAAQDAELRHARADIEGLEITLPLRYVDVASAEFPAALKTVFTQYAKSSKSVALKDELRTVLAQRVLETDADPSLKKAVELFVAKM